ncbi:right-handed parallel beta-helix repeat-containing protein [Clavibacter sp. MX14-G9D]|uniref:right-handed parallel beta-helix repeat-containing protein n=1 Tax=Clavibacter sp. MX14-G9D TaxID=3064656 RepID=UPI00293E4478|nr:right-handed parallel beta-helix repeat-containing protein [Clavibacter sp. MX14-G9D]
MTSHPHTRIRATSRIAHGALAAFSVTALTTGMLVDGVDSAAASTMPVDTFTRQVAVGRGTADGGASYTLRGERGATFSVDGTRARISGIAAGTSAAASLDDAPMRDGSVAATVALVGTAPLGLYQGLEIRRQPDGTSYRGRVEFGRSGAVRVSITRTAADGSSTDLGSPVALGTAAAGTSVHVEVQATGTSPVALSVRAWPMGTAKPAWHAMATDATAARISAPGGTGVWSYASGSNSGPTTVAFDDLAQVAADPSAATQPTPSISAPAPTRDAVPTPAPASSPAPAAVPTSYGPRGSAPVGSAVYPAPAGALYVNALVGRDTAAGTKAAPLKTLAAAVMKAKAGQTIVLRAGTYHEAVVVPFNKPLTIQSFPREAVWLDGSSKVTGWTKSGTSWVARGWAVKVPRTIAGVADNPRFVRPEAPMAARTDQVFVAGTPLRQVATAAQVVPGTFFVDETAKTIRIGTNPIGKEVRASDLRQALQIQSADATVQGIGIRRYATSYEDRGALRFDNVRATARDLVIQDNAMVGIALGNNDATVSRLTVQRSGMLGLSTGYSYGLVVEDSVFTQNNSERFKAAPVSGGIKIARARDVTVVNNDTSRNFGSGIWLDESCYDITIVGNTSNDNEYTGIQLELSAKAVVADNSTTGGQTGIQIIGTGDVQVFNNTMGSNSKMGLALLQDERRQAVADYEGQDPRQPAVDPTVPWLTRDITVSDNVFANGGRFSVYALDQRTRIPVDRWNLVITGNLFTKRVATTDPTMVAWGQGDNATLVRYETAEALAAAKGTTWRNTVTPSSTSSADMAQHIAPASAAAVPLPAPIAALVGQLAGVKHVGTF